MIPLQIGVACRPVSGAWPCGCDDTEGEITKMELIDNEQMAFVGTSCGWQWFPISELKPKEV